MVVLEQLARNTLKTGTFLKKSKDFFLQDYLKVRIYLTIFKDIRFSVNILDLAYCLFFCLPVNKNGLISFELNYQITFSIGIKNKVRKRHNQLIQSSTTNLTVKIYWK